MKALFGGKDSSAQDAQIQSNRDAINLIKANTAEARDDAFRLFPEAEEARRAGFQSALDLLSGTIPAQFDVLQEGRQNVQDTLLRGHDAVIAALMGTPVDMSGMRKRPLTVNRNLFIRSLPEAAIPDPPDLTGYVHPSVYLSGNFGRYFQ